MNLSFYVNYTNGTHYEKYFFEGSMKTEFAKLKPCYRYLISKFFDLPVGLREIELDHKISFYSFENFDKIALNKIIEKMKPKNFDSSSSSSDD